MILLLGGRGFVGTAFERVCRSRHLDVVVVDRQNYRDFVGSTCDIVINANGNSRKPLASAAPMDDFDASVRTVRQTLVDFHCKSYVYLSSCDVYADCSSPATTDEAQALDVTKQSPYGFHKYLAENCVRHAAPAWLIARLGGLVGPGLWKNAVFDILNGGPLWLDPASELQFMSVDDCARIVLDLAERRTGDVFNVCGRGVIRLADVIAAAGMD